MIIKFNLDAAGNDKFHRGLNTTVRKYQGPYVTDAPIVGDTVVLSDLHSQILGFGVVERIYVGPMGQIPQSFLNYEHNPLCTDHRGLKSTMTQVYGGIVRMTDTVIAIMFSYREKA